MKRDVAEFVTKGLVCQRVKTEHQVPSGLLQPIRIPEWKWDRITMDFMVGLPLTGRKHDSVWVVVDRLTKTAHFLPVRTDYSLDKLAELYIKEIVRLHGIPLVKVLWRNHKTEEATWESEETMRQQYLQLFNEGNFEDEIFLSGGEL